MNPSEITHKLFSESLTNGKLYVLYPKDKDVLDLGIDFVLIDLIALQEMTSHAAYIINFKPVAGDYTPWIKDKYTLSGVPGVFGRISYTTYTQFFKISKENT